MKTILPVLFFLLIAPFSSAQINYNFLQVSVGTAESEDNFGFEGDATLWGVYGNSELNKNNYLEYLFSFAKNDENTVHTYTYGVGIGGHKSISDSVDVFGSVGLVGVTVDTYYADSSGSEPYFRLGMRNQYIRLMTTIIDGESGHSLEFDLPIDKSTTINFSYSTSTIDYDNGYEVETNGLAIGFKATF